MKTRRSVDEVIGEIADAAVSLAVLAAGNINGSDGLVPDVASRMFDAMASEAWRQLDSQGYGGAAVRLRRRYATVRNDMLKTRLS